VRMFGAGGSQFVRSAGSAANLCEALSRRQPDLMVIYNESWAAISVTNFSHWSHRPWKVLARSGCRAGPTSASRPNGRVARTPAKLSLSNFRFL
jgi:hypothetical protein